MRLVIFLVLVLFCGGGIVLGAVENKAGEELVGKEIPEFKEDGLPARDARPTGVGGGSDPITSSSSDVASKSVVGTEEKVLEDPKLQRTAKKSPRSKGPSNPKLPPVDSDEAAVMLDAALRAKPSSLVLSTSNSSSDDPLLELRDAVRECHARGRGNAKQQRLDGRTRCLEEEQRLAVFRRLAREETLRVGTLVREGQGKIGLARCKEGAGCLKELAGFSLFVRPKVGGFIDEKSFQYDSWFKSNAVGRQPSAFRPNGARPVMTLREEEDGEMESALHLCGADGCALDGGYLFTRRHPRATRLAEKLAESLPDGTREVVNAHAVLRGDEAGVYSGWAADATDELPSGTELLAALEHDPDHFRPGDAARVDAALAGIRSSLILPAIVANDYIRRMPSVLTSGTGTASMQDATDALFRHWPRVYSEHAGGLRMTPFGMHKVIIPISSSIRARVFDPRDVALLYPDAARSFPQDLDPFAVPGEASVDPHGATRGDGPELTTIDTQFVYLARKYPCAPLARASEFKLAPGDALFVPAGAPVAWHAVDPHGHHSHESVIVVEHAFLDASVLTHARAELLHGAFQRNIERGLLEFLSSSKASFHMSRLVEPISVASLHDPHAADVSKGLEQSFAASALSSTAEQNNSADSTAKQNMAEAFRNRASAMKRRAGWRIAEEWNAEIEQLTALGPPLPTVASIGRRNLTVAWEDAILKGGSGAKDDETSKKYLVVWSLLSPSVAPRTSNSQIGPSPPLEWKAGAKRPTSNPAFTIAGAKIHSITTNDASTDSDADPSAADTAAILLAGKLAPEFVASAVQSLAGTPITSAMVVGRKRRAKDFGYEECPEDVGQAIVSSVGGRSACVLLSALHPDRPYLVRVAEVTKSGVSAWSDWSEPVRTDPIEAPTRPQSVVAKRLTATSAHVGWEPPVDDGGGHVLGYVVRLQPFVGSSSSDVGLQSRRSEELVAVVPPTRGITMHGLLPGVVYDATIAAVSAGGVSPFTTVLAPCRVDAGDSSLQDAAFGGMGVVVIGQGGEAEFPGDGMGREGRPPPSQSQFGAGVARPAALDPSRGHPPSSSAEELADRTTTSFGLGSASHALAAHLALSTLADRNEAVQDPASTLMRSSLFDTKSHQYISPPSLPPTGVQSLAPMFGIPSNEVDTLQYLWSIFQRQENHLNLTSPSSSSTPSLADVAGGTEEPCVGPVAWISDVLRTVAVMNGSQIIRSKAWEAHQSPRKFDVRAEIVASAPLTGRASKRSREDNSDRFRRRIVLFERGGNVALVQKVQQAASAGAVGVIIFDNTGRCDDDTFTQVCVPGSDVTHDEGFASQDPPNLWSQLNIPALLVSRSTGEAILSMMGTPYRFRPAATMGMHHRVIRTDEKVRTMLGPNRGGHDA